MKKIISMLAAVAMTTSLFVTSVSADTKPYYKATVTKLTDITEYTAYVTDELEESVPQGYDFYQVDISLPNAGAFTNTNTSTSKTERKKPTGTGLITTMFVKFEFGKTDMAKLIQDTNYIYSRGLFPLMYITSESALSVRFEDWLNTVEYPINAKTVSSVKDGDVLCSFVLPVQANESVTAYITDDSLYMTADMDAGTFMDPEEISTDNKKLQSAAANTLTFGGATGLPESGTTVVSETTLDSSDTQAIDNTNTYPATVGSAKILKNYAIDKVTFAPAKGSLGKYYLKATDDQGKTKVWKMFTADSNPDATDETHDGFTDHKGGKIETQIKNGEITEASFYIMIRSANHKIAKYEVYTAE